MLKIGDPSTMKSRSISAVTKPLRRIDHELAHDYQVAMAGWPEQPKDGAEGHAQPKKLRAMIFDTTIEATQEILQDSPAGVLLEDDELCGWFDAMYKYSGARGAQKDRSFWLKAYDGGAEDRRPHRARHRAYPQPVGIDRGAHRSPGRSASSPMRAKTTGCCNASIRSCCVRPSGGRDEPPGPAVADFDTLSQQKLRELKSESQLPCLKFDDGALKIREELERKHLDLMQIEWLNRKLTSHFGKYNGMFARLCLIWHCVEYASSGRCWGPLPAVITEAPRGGSPDFLHGFLSKHAFAFYTSVLGLSNDHDRLSNSPTTYWRTG